MVALLVLMAVMAVAMTAALPAWSTLARREKEAELVFRGEQYARAIVLFQRKYTGTFPPTLDVLVNERFLRKKYKDPITNEDFKTIGVGRGGAGRRRRTRCRRSAAGRAGAGRPDAGGTRAERHRHGGRTAAAAQPAAAASTFSLGRSSAQWRRGGGEASRNSPSAPTPASWA